MSSSRAYRAATDHVAFRDQTARIRLEVTGPDRAKFLHNLTTNEVKRLPVGRGCEAFVTSTQGKTLAFVKLLNCADSIMVSADPGGLDQAFPHLRKYGIFDEIGLEDRSDTTFELHLAGPNADELIRRAGASLPEPTPLAHLTTTLADFQVLVWRDSPTGRPGLSVMGARGAQDGVMDQLKRHGRALGLDVLDADSFEAMRIEAGTPVFGRDLTEKNLPQEASRDELAINFVKGCYLGQETVARIDALGHVNQVLKGLRLPSGAPTPHAGTTLVAAGKRVGLVTSAAFSPGWNGPIALAMIRGAHGTPGTPLAVNLLGETTGDPIIAIVSDLPMLPPP